MHLLAGLKNPIEGSIEINGNLLFDSRTGKNISSHKRKVGYVFQEGRVFPHLNVEQNLKYGWKKDSHGSQYFTEIVDLLELKPLLKNRPVRLSGGEKQRVAIGRTLMSRAQILLLDEPFTGLDPSLKKQVISLLNRVIHHLDIPVILVSHDLQDLLMLTTYLILVHEGKAHPPESYLELIRKHKLLEFNGLVNHYYNIYEGIVKEIIPEKGLACVSLKDASDLSLNIESDEFLFHPGDPVKISLRGADVALSLRKLDKISIRNQLKGKVEILFRHRNHMVCIVDCGIRIITRVTIDSAKSLVLEEGKEVWCLFKSLAIESYK